MATGVDSWSQTASSNASADSSVNWAEGMSPASVNDSSRAGMASVAKWRDDNNGSLLTGGSSTAYTVTTNQGFASYSALNGRSLTIRFNATSGAAPTLAVDGLAAKVIRIDATTAPSTGAIRANSIHRLTYDNALQIWIVHSGHSLVEPGRISPHAASSAPNGWLLCDGSAVSRTTYADLFAIISTTYGTGNGSTTFNVPDLRGRVAVGKDNMGGTAASRVTSAICGIAGNTLGASGGDQRMQEHNHDVDENGGHSHDLRAANTAGSATTLVDRYISNWGNVWTQFPDSNMGATTTEETGIEIENEGDGSSQNVQPSLILNYIIKT